MKKFLFLTAVFLMLSATAVFAADTADIIFVVDESGSMGGEHAWIPGMISDLEAGLIAAGVGDTGAGFAANQYAIVGFGASSYLPHTVTGLTGAAGAVTGASGLVTSGGFEDGYAGIQYSLDTFSFRADAAVNIVLITDEDRDIYSPQYSSTTYASLLSDLTSQNILLNAVVNNPFTDGAGAQAIGRFADGKDLNPLFDSDGNPVVGGTAAVENAILADGSGGYTLSTGAVTGNGYINTETEYVALALEAGGAAWDLNILRNGGDDATSFTAAFVDFKVEEIKGQPPSGVPEPATLFLLGTGLLGLAALRRSRIK